MLAYGLWQLQVMQSDYYASAAEKNRIRNVPVLAPRGKILDREGRTIVDNYPSFSALLLRDSSRDLNADADLIAQGLHLDPDEVRTRIRHFASMPQYQPIFLKEDITPDELAFIEAHRNELPELDTIMAHRRLYPRNGFMAHLIGYVGEVSEDMLNQPQFELYNPGDVVGVSGVERQYNTLLMGQNGARQALVNSHGREVGLLGETEAIPGKQLKLTVDIDLQIAAEEALEGKNGAIVAMDPRTGEILAMVSRPTFDPNDFAVRVSRDEWNKLVTDPDKPLLNKAIQAQLAPGSTFKIIMAVAGWQEGIAQTLHVNCAGGAEFYGRCFGCWVTSASTARHVDLEKAIYQSCDVFFYTLAEKLGIDRIAKYATMLGLGQKTGIDLPKEVERRDAVGRMEDPELQAEMVCRRNDFGGHRPGRGGDHSGPVGARDQRHLHGRAHGRAARRRSRRTCRRDTSRQSNVTDVKSSSDRSERLGDHHRRHVATCFCPRGTASDRRASPGIDIAGKTGTAQIVSQRPKAKHARTAKKIQAQNGWFVGFTPRRNPDIVVCVLFQGGEARQAGGTRGDAGDQGLRRKAAPQSPRRWWRSRRPTARSRSAALWTVPDADGDEAEDCRAGTSARPGEAAASGWHAAVPGMSTAVGRESAVRA